MLNPSQFQKYDANINNSMNSNKGQGAPPNIRNHHISMNLNDITKLSDPSSYLQDTKPSFIINKNHKYQMS